MSSKLLMKYENFKTWHKFMELCYGCNSFVNNVYSHFVKIIWFFCDRLMDTKYITISFLYFWTKLRYCYNYYIVILQLKVELYIENNCIMHLSMTNRLLWNSWVKIYFYVNFRISFQVHVVQFGITFDMHAKIHLIWKIVKHFQIF
jgi:hypothetical protein